jgi:peptidyl-prolyl cis-trans isomerase SurA
MIIAGMLMPTVSLAAERLDGVVAVVNDDVVTKSELNNAYKLLLTRVPDRTQLPAKDVLTQQVLNKVIMDKLQLQLAQKRSVSVESEQINTAILEMAKHSGTTPAGLRAKLEQQGINYDYFRKTVKEELIIAELQQREVGLDSNVSDNEVDSFVGSPVGQDLSGVEYNLGHILITDADESESGAKRALDKANAVIAKIKSGADFAQVAMADSSGSTALKGGDLGFRTIAEVPSIFVDKVTLMQVGDLVGPIKTASGYHIIKLKNKKVGSGGGDASIAAVKQRAKLVLQERKFNERLELWLKRLRFGAKIQNNLAAYVK